jgi:hypothetical protein
LALKDILDLDLVISETIDELKKGYKLLDRLKMNNLNKQIDLGTQIITDSEKITKISKLNNSKNRFQLIANI